MPTAAQDELTALLSRLQLRLDAVGPLLTDAAQTGLVHRVERLLAGARATDHMFGAMNDLYAGAGKTADMSVRDRYMAETLAWHLHEAGPEAKIVIAAHNNHIQKTANAFGCQITALPMGQHLAGMLGTDYLSVAVTHTDQDVPEMIPDPSLPVGFRLQDTSAAELVPGSIGHALGEAGLAGEITLTDLRWGTARWSVAGACWEASARSRVGCSPRRPHSTRWSRCPPSLGTGRSPSDLPPPPRRANTWGRECRGIWFWANLVWCR